MFNTPDTKYFNGWLLKISHILLHLFFFTIVNHILRRKNIKRQTIRFQWLDLNSIKRKKNHKYDNWSIHSLNNLNQIRILYISTMFRTDVYVFTCLSHVFSETSFTLAIGLVNCDCASGRWDWRQTQFWNICEWPDQLFNPVV